MEVEEEKMQEERCPHGRDATRGRPSLLGLTSWSVGFTNVRTCGIRNPGEIGSNCSCSGNGLLTFIDFSLEGTPSVSACN